MYEYDTPAFTMGTVSHLVAVTATHPCLHRIILLLPAAWDQNPADAAVQQMTKAITALRALMQPRGVAVVVQSHGGSGRPCDKVWVTAGDGKHCSGSTALASGVVGMEHTQLL